MTTVILPDTHNASSISYKEVTTLVHWEAFAKIGQLTSALATHLKQNLSSEAKLQSQTQVLQALPPPGAQSYFKQCSRRAEFMNEGTNLSFHPPEQCACQ